MDKITIDRLKIFCNHGVYEDEKRNGQNFYVTAVLNLDTYSAGVSDDLNKSVNYAKLCRDITDFMQENRYNLIEAAAENLASYILAENPAVRGLELTVHKPEAPIGLPFENVSVSICREWQRAYIALGSNMGNSRALLDGAVNKISENPAVRLLKKSSYILTKPYGGVEQEDFWNGCIEVETHLSPKHLLEFLHTVENEAGRKREIHWGPRTLDLDIILYGDRIINSEFLTVPHCDMQNRMFVLEPLCEIAPYAYNPILKKTAAQLKKELERRHEC
ncbi:MAG: 2-amino-4-hydroxy-6-hydroxymethyldihydropteridine diphosphokinase [Butyrivibrio sp.]|nr:2-amino-4-hydroxy-6-hydroxymethyldihydropteridine diphosphokinase [Butyrivibrio sp.]